MMKLNYRRILFILLIFIYSPDRMYAQVPSLTNYKTQIVAQYSYGRFENQVRMGFSQDRKIITSVYQLTGAFRFGENHLLAINLPYVINDREIFEVIRSESHTIINRDSDFGNISLTYQYRLNNKIRNLSHFTSFQIYIPSAQNFTRPGMYNDWNNFFKYLQSLYGAFKVSYAGLFEADHFALSSELSYSELYVIPDESIFSPGQGRQNFIHYGIGISLKTLNALAFKLKLLGLYGFNDKTTNGYDFSPFSTSQNQLTLAIQYKFQRITSEISYQIYLNDLNQYVDPIIGFNIGIYLEIL